MPNQLYAADQPELLASAVPHYAAGSDSMDQWHSHEPLYQGRKMPLQEMSCLAYFDEAVQQSPDAPAISMHGQTLNYAEVSLSADALAQWFLQEANVKPGERIALYLPNNLSYMMVILAAWRARLVVTNLSFVLENSYILHQLQDSGAKLLVTIPGFLQQVEQILLQTSIRHIITTQADDHQHFLGRLKTWFSPRKWLEQWRKDTTMIRYIPLRKIFKKYQNTTSSWPEPDLDDIALIQYTSGTTDAPKGVVLTHRNLSANSQQTRQILNDSLSGANCGLCPVPLQHVVGVIFCLIMLSTGAHVVLTSISELLGRSKTLQQYPLDLMVGMPHLYNQILQQEVVLHLVKKMELFLCGGSLASRHLQQQWQDITGRNLCEALGLSETAPMVCINPPRRIHVGTVGVVLPNTEVCVVGSRGQSLSFNQPGELWVRGPQMMRGYWHKPWLTQQVMTHDGWFKTGDMVTIAEDGFITMLERQCDVLQWRNQLIFPHEIEQKICQHEEVADCVLLQDESHPKAPVRLVVVAKQALSPEHLRNYIVTHLPLGVVPDTIEFTSHLPRTPMGRIFRRLLRKVPLQASPVGTSAAQAGKRAVR